eukprot:402243_1
MAEAAINIVERAQQMSDLRAALKLDEAIQFFAEDAALDSPMKKCKGKAEIRKFWEDHKADAPPEFKPFVQESPTTVVRDAKVKMMFFKIKIMQRFTFDLSTGLISKLEMIKK